MSRLFGHQGWSGKFASHFASWVIRNKWAVLGSVVAVVGVLAFGVKNLQVTDDYRIWFDKDNAELKEFDKLQSSYTKADNIFLLVAPKDGNVFTQKTLEDLVWLTQKAWKTPYSGRVDSLTNFQRTKAKRDDLIVGDLVKNPAKLSAKDLQEIREYALHEPMLVKNVVSTKGHVAGINVTLNFPGKAPTEISDVAAYGRQLKKELEARNPNLKVYLSGFVMMNATDAELSVADMSTLIPLMYALLIICLSLTLRSFSSVITTLGTVTLGVLTSMGVAGWLGYSINTLSAIAPTIIMTLAISDCVHVLITFFQQLRLGKTKEEAIHDAISWNIYPAFMTSLSNAVGYAAMNFSESPPFREFGNIIAVGSVAELALAYLFIPALVLILPIRGRKNATAESVQNTRLEDGMASFVIRNRFRLLGTAAGLTLFFGYFLFQNVLDEDFMSWYAPRTHFRADTDFISKNLTGVFDLQYSLNAKDASGIYKPEFLKEVAAFTEWARQQPEVESVDSLTDILKRINKSMHGDKPQWAKLPEGRNQIAQYFLMYEMSLPYGMSLTSYYNRDKSATRVILRIKNLTAQNIIALDQRAKGWLGKHTTLTRENGSYSASVSMLYGMVSMRMIEGMVNSFTFSFITISVLLMLIFRSVKVGLISLVPNLVPGVIAFGIWGMTSGIIGMTVAIVCSTSLGLVVDSTIHFFSHYLEGRRDLQYSPEQSAIYAYTRSGRAILVTDVILVLGFALLMLSPFGLNSVMGQMTAMTLFFDVLVTLFLYVPVILAFDKNRNDGEGSFLESLTDGSFVKAIAQKFKKAPKTAVPGAMVIVALLIPAGLANANGNRGLEIARKAFQKRSGFHDYVAHLKMTIKEKGGSGQSSSMKLSVLEVNGDGEKELVTFEAPGDVKGTSFLTFTHKRDEDDQWLYLPSVKRVKRISSTNKSGPFMGSEFAYEDISDMAVEKFQYKFVREDKCDLGRCFVVEQTPVYADSGYSKELVWYDTQNYRVTRVEYFDRKGEPLKTFKASGFRTYAKWWRPSRMEMVNTQTGNSTVLEWSGVKYRTGLLARDFDTNSLQRGR